MALRSCPDCGNAVSTKAPICPKCGRNLKSATPMGCLSGCVLVVLIGFLGFFGLAYFVGPSSRQEVSGRTSVAPPGPNPIPVKPNPPEPPPATSEDKPAASAESDLPLATRQEIYRRDTFDERRIVAEGMDRYPKAKGSGAFFDADQMLAYSQFLEDGKHEAEQALCREFGINLETLNAIRQEGFEKRWVVPEK